MNPQQTNTLFAAVRSGFLLIFSATIISTLTQQFLDKKIELILRSTEGLTSMIWVWGFFSLLSALIFPLLLSLLTSYFLIQNQEPRPVQFIEKHFELGLIESLRSWGKSFLWFFVLVIPGFIYFFYYSLSPQIVYFSNKYQSGEIDALAESEKYVKKNWFFYSVVTFIFYFILPMIMTSVFDEYRLFSLHPGWALGCIALETLLFICFQYLMINKLIDQLIQEKDYKYASYV